MHAPTHKQPDHNQATARSRRPAPRAAGSMAVVVVSTMVVLLIAACSYLNQDVIRKLFGPPAVAMTESYADQPDGPVFDHSLFDAVLQKHVDGNGLVDYAKLAADPDALDQYIGLLAEAPLDRLGRNQRLALLINAYNAFTLRLILDHHPVKSIKDIPAAKRWDHVRWRIGDLTLSLNQIEHEQIRPHFKEPRIHFALVCAAIGCPPLANSVYTADQLESQLARQTTIVHSQDRWFRFDPQKPSVVHLTSLYDWYGGDFEQDAGSVLNYVAQQVPELKKAIDAGKKPKIRWLDYDWSLNGRS